MVRRLAATAAVIICLSSIIYLYFIKDRIGPHSPIDPISGDMFDRTVLITALKNGVYSSETVVSSHEIVKTMNSVEFIRGCWNSDVISVYENDTSGMQYKILFKYPDAGQDYTRDILFLYNSNTEILSGIGRQWKDAGLLNKKLKELIEKGSTQKLKPTDHEYE